MKKAWILLAVIGLSASLGAQSVAELAKRERARREALKGRHAVVIRNRDLLALQKLPAVEITSADEATASETQNAEPSDVPGGTIPEGSQIVPRVEENGPAFMGEGVPERLGSSTRALEVQLQAATDLVDLLTTKMNALRQQYEYQDAMVPGYVIQQQIDETNQRLVKAQAQLARIQAEIDRKSPGKKEPGAVER
jgi:hypothetical protein